MAKGSAPWVTSDSQEEPKDKAVRCNRHPVWPPLSAPVGDKDDFSGTLKSVFDWELCSTSGFPMRNPWIQKDPEVFVTAYD